MLLSVFLTANGFRQSPCRFVRAFYNPTPQEVNVYWVDQNGQNQIYIATAVRHPWSNFTLANLYKNPAEPLRTDNFKLPAPEEFLAK